MMRIGRVRTGNGILHVREHAGGWREIEDPYVAFEAGRVAHDRGAAVTGRLLAPCAPPTVVGIAQNGRLHAAPVQAWLKSPRTVVPSGTSVALRRDAGTTVAEAEIAVVIGRETSGLTAATAHEFVLGLTAVNDMSSPDRSAHDPRNFESKAGVGYTPLGPWIDTAADLDRTTVSLRIDGAEIAGSDAAALPVPIRECLEYVASWLPLGPGDVVMTGAPFTGAPVRPGQTMEVEVGSVTLVTPTI